MALFLYKVTFGGAGGQLGLQEDPIQSIAPCLKEKTVWVSSIIE